MVLDNVGAKTVPICNRPHDMGQIGQTQIDIHNPAFPFKWGVWHITKNGCALLNFHEY